MADYQIVVRLITDCSIPYLHRYSHIAGLDARLFAQVDVICIVEQEVWRLG